MAKWKVEHGTRTGGIMALVFVATSSLFVTLSVYFHFFFNKKGVRNDSPKQKKSREQRYLKLSVDVQIICTH